MRARHVCATVALVRGVLVAGVLVALVATAAVAQEPPSSTAAAEARAAGEVVEIVPPTRLIYLPGRFAASCPDDLGVKEAVMKRLGRSPFDEPAERIVVVALTGSDDDTTATHANVELFTQGFDSLGARDLDSDEGCAELVEAAALAISIALAPNLALAPQPPPPPMPIPDEDAVEDASVEAPAEPAPTTAEPLPANPRWEPPGWLPTGAALLVGGGGHASFFLAPQSALAVHLAVAVRQGPWELRLENRQHIPGWDGDLLVVHGGGGWSLLPCGHAGIFDVASGTVGVAGCLAASQTNLWAIGGYIGGAFSAGLGGRVGLEWKEPSFAGAQLWLQAEATVVQPTFYAINGPAVWKQTVPFNFGLGVTYDLAWPP
jgi:hypothetical protein